MNELYPKIDPLINKAQLYLSEIQSILKQLVKETADAEQEDSDENRVISIQLTLKYRLSCEDALGFLLKMDQNLLFSLGIQPQQPSMVNRDRLAYAIGNEDLKQILNILAILTGSLSKIVARYKNNHASFALRNTRSQKQCFINQELSLLLNKQNQFVEVLKELDPELALIKKTQAGEPIYDYIAALRGPISHFHQAILNGLEQTKPLYSYFNKKPILDHQLHALLKETEKVLHLMPSTYNPQPYHPIKQFAPTKTAEQLEQCAAAKRLRPFFGKL